MPSALAHQPRLAKLRSMALTHIIQQGARELDAFLASPRGRHTLQAMPADAVAALLASDDLALASEDSILTAIEVWLAGPVAATTTAGATAGTSAQGVVQQLVAAVRLPLCSGGFLAAAVQRLPWLCGGLTAQQLADAAVLQRYYRWGMCVKLLAASMVAWLRCPRTVINTALLHVVLPSSPQQRHHGRPLPAGNGAAGRITCMPLVRAHAQGHACCGRRCTQRTAECSCHRPQRQRQKQRTGHVHPPVEHQAAAVWRWCIGAGSSVRGRGAAAAGVPQWLSVARVPHCRACAGSRW
jgi:hypothetical protein